MFIGSWFSELRRPRRSILGPLLFLIYVNDVASRIDPKCKLILYADNSEILFSRQLRRYHI